MHSTFVILGLLGAGALAHPPFQHRHPHNKRDTFVTSTLGAYDVLVEDVQEVTVTVSTGQVLSSPTTTSIAAPEKLAVEAPAEPSSTTPVAIPEKLAVKPLPTTPSSITPVVISTPTSTPPASSTPVVAPAPASASPASSSGGSNTFWATSPSSPMDGSSGAKDILTSANYWRKQWKGLPPFTWSPVLANNSYMTATQPTYYTTGTNPTTGQTEQVPHNEGGGKVEGHFLYSGSSSQCIGQSILTSVTPSGITPFEFAFLNWICEEGNPNVPCDQLHTPALPGIEAEPFEGVGHAAIIAGTVSQIGCYSMDPGDGKTMWTCDFAN